MSSLKNQIENIKKYADLVYSHLEKNNASLAALVVQHSNLNFKRFRFPSRQSDIARFQCNSPSALRQKVCKLKS
jgi:hypothetical protein